MNPNQQNNLIQSINKAKEALSLVQNPIESLAKNNISVEFLDDLKNYINNNPTSDWIFSILKKDKNSALQGIEAAKQYLLNNKNNEGKQSSLPNYQLNTQTSITTPIDDLDKFKRGLSRLRK